MSFGSKWLNIILLLVVSLPIILVNSINSLVLLSLSHRSALSTTLSSKYLNFSTSLYVAPFTEVYFSSSTEDLYTSPYWHILSLSTNSKTNLLAICVQHLRILCTVIISLLITDSEWNLLVTFDVDKFTAIYHWVYKIY